MKDGKMQDNISKMSSTNKNFTISISKNLIFACGGAISNSPYSRAQLRAMIRFSIVLIALACIPKLVASRRYDDQGYDPEQQDGIPVFSARSIARPSSSSLDDDWSNNGDSEHMSAAPNQPMPVQRRQSDADLDDGIEDEEEDEYKSGSSPHESIESPGYGESRRFAQDGDEIEDFFDRHLGPPKETVAAESSPSASSQLLLPAVDPDDQYEAAASSPLSTIFHSLLGHHDHKHTKRPFLQIATSSSDSNDASSADSSKTSKGLTTSQSAQSYVEAAPFALAITPIAAPSTIAAHEQSQGGHEQQDPQATYGQEQDYEGQAQPGSGVREIYIGRRPTVMSYLQQTQAAQQQQQQQQQQLAPPGYNTAGSANVWRGPNGSPMMYEQEQSADYARHPVAASYAHQREQPTGASSAASPVAEDEQTVTYGLSFGGGENDSGSKDEPAADQESEQPNEEASQGVDSPESQQGYVPHNTRYSTSSTRAHNNYYQNQYGAPAGYIRANPTHQYYAGRQHYHPQQMMMVQQQQQQQQHHYQPRYQQQYASGATRYHRDPSESANHLAAMRAAHMGIRFAGVGQQHRGVGNQDVHSNAYGKERERLIASLDHEIKATPQYQQNNAAAATAHANLYARRPNGRYPDRQHLVAFKAVKKGYLGNDLDSFNSYHSEVDPYKTFTKTSRMINGDPLSFLANNRQTVQSGTGSHGGEQESGRPHVLVSQLNNQESTRPTNSNDNRTNPSPADANPSSRHENNNLLTGPLTNYDSHQAGGRGDLLRTAPGGESGKVGHGGSASDEANSSQGLSRVRRDDSDEREIDDDSDDDGVWVDDDGDDDNKQQSSDLNETAQEPEDEEEEDGQHDAASNVPTTHPMNPPGVIGGPHGYELSPNDLMIYHG